MGKQNQKHKPPKQTQNKSTSPSPSASASPSTSPSPSASASPSTSPSSSPIPKHSPRTTLIIWLLNTISAVAITYYMLSKIFKKTYTLAFLYQTADYPKVIQSIAIVISCILILHTFSADWLDIVFHKTQNDIYRSHVNVTWNTILWVFVLIGLYSYANGKVFVGTNMMVMLVDLFFIGRILFSVGYVIGAAVGLQSFRAVGFGLSFGPIIAIAAEISGHSMAWMFK